MKLNFVPLLDFLFIYVFLLLFNLGQFRKDQNNIEKNLVDKVEELQQEKVKLREQMDQKDQQLKAVDGFLKYLIQDPEIQKQLQSLNHKSEEQRKELVKQLQQADMDKIVENIKIYSDIRKKITFIPVTVCNNLEVRVAGLTKTTMTNQLLRPNPNVSDLVAAIEDELKGTVSAGVWLVFSYHSNVEYGYIDAMVKALNQTEYRFVDVGICYDSECE